MRNWKIILPFIPLILIVLTFFYLPLFESFSKSLYSYDGTYIGFARYSKLLSNSEFVEAFWFTFEIAIISTIISIVLAVVIALALRDTFVGKRISIFLNQMNISMPHLVMATLVVYLLTQKGFISTVLYHLGIIESWTDFPRIVEYASPLGVIVSYCLKFTPFICMTVLAVLHSTSQDYEDQSLALGVGKIKTFFYVTFPSIVPALISMGIISFTFALGCFDVPTVLLNRKVLSTFAYDRYYAYYDPNGMYDGYAASIIISIIIIILSSIFLYISSKRSDTFE